jgi:hypothetical protein
MFYSSGSIRSATDKKACMAGTRTQFAARKDGPKKRIASFHLIFMRLPERFLIQTQGENDPYAFRHWPCSPGSRRGGSL